MTGGPRRTARTIVIASIAVVAMGAVSVLSSCSSDDGGSTGAKAKSVPAGLHADGTPILGPVVSVPPADPARHTGPQGRVGQFVVGCTYSHSDTDDPIVHRGMHGMSHRHDFYGFTETDQNTTAPDMVGGETTCDKTVDTAAYWHPTLYDHGKIVVPDGLNAYYRAAPGIDPREVQTMPLGLAMLAGDQMATTPQPGDATGWTCGIRGTLSDDPPECPASAPLHLVLTFADCWDGEHLDSEDHVSHVAYSVDGACPTTHPVSIPQLAVAVAFPISGPGHDLSLASGNIYSAHGDFLNGWSPAGLKRELDACLRRGAICDLGTNRGEEGLFSAQ